jgi:hypothetical protein
LLDCAILQFDQRIGDYISAPEGRPQRKSHHSRRLRQNIVLLFAAVSGIG